MDMEAIETVQRRATKLVPNLRNVDYSHYSQRLKILKLPSMQYRLRRGDMIQVYKIVKGLDRVPSEMFFKFCDAISVISFLVKPEGINGRFSNHSTLLM